MVELTYNSAFVLYLGLTLACVLGVWFYEHYKAKKRVIIPCEQRLSICEYCHFAYLGDAAKKMSRCPQCQSINTIKQP